MESESTPATPGEPGRPPLKVTAVMRKQVSVAVAAGMTQDQISSALGISRTTLNKYFGYELSEGAHKRRFEMVNALFKTGVKGNVSAQKAFLSTSMAPTPTGPGESEPEAQQAGRGLPMGKKEQRQRESENAEAGTGWDGLLNPPSMPH